MAKIYISSTYIDLKEYREAVYHTLRQLGHDAIAMEDYVATDQRPLSKCLADVAGCDLYIGIFAWRYGYIPEQDNPEHKSITEREFDEATEQHIPRLIFLLEDGTAWPPNWMDAQTSDGDMGRKIVSFRKKLKTDKTVSFFSNPDQLAQLASVAVQKEMGQAANAVPLRLDIARGRVILHMRRFGGARSEESAMKRYLPLRLRVANPLMPDATSRSTSTMNLSKYPSLPSGGWKDLVTYPTLSLLVGDTGSGKTTTLLNESMRLFKAAMTDDSLPIPLYVSLAHFEGGDASTLLEMAASENGIQPDQLQSLWHERQRQIVILIDALDEVRYVPPLTGAIQSLCEGAVPDFHSVIVACRPGHVYQSLREAIPSLREFLLLPLSDSEINGFLDNYDASALATWLDARLREVIQKPDLLSGFAQSAKALPANQIPRNAGGIYQLYIEHLFKVKGEQYDYELVKSPVLAFLAYEMLRTAQTELLCDDAFYDRIADWIEPIAQRYQRRRRILPQDWSAEGLFDETLKHLVLEEVVAPTRKLGFSKQYFRDYFAAVYLTMKGVNSPEAQELISSIGLERLMQMLIIWMGITPQAVSLFETLPPATLQLGTQLWFENRPVGIAAPGFILKNYRQHLAELESIAGSKSEDLATTAEPRPSMEREEPRRRLERVCVGAKAGPAGVQVLVDSLFDDHPLVRGAAQYALLHLGEFILESEPFQPVAPLLEIGNRVLRFTCYGGGRVEIGPLLLLQVPFPASTFVTVDINELDFDPFETPSRLDFHATPPSLFAARLFQARKKPDWLELAAHCYWIARHSANLIRALGSPSSLADFLSQVQQRAARFASLAQLLFSDLAIPWQHIDLEVPASVFDEEKANYDHLRRLYSRDYQSRAREALGRDGSGGLEINQTINLLTGKAIALRARNVNIGRDDDPGDQTRSVEFNQTVRSIEQGVLIGMEIADISGASQQLPTLITTRGTTKINEVSGGAIFGLRIARIRGGPFGWGAEMSIQVGHFTKSSVSGVIVGTFDPLVSGD